MQDIFNRLERIDYLIRIKGTGTPSQLASRMGVGERTIYEYISIMKELGAPIRFCRSRQSYCYDQEGEFTISFISRAS
ncbi:MAG TPA: HTH domain-containing protein [Chitinophagaceae bacterium]|jgi:predicted DNA-binding transcriptional regulator YafY